MGLTVGELNVKLEASAQEFQAQLADVEAQLDDLATTAQAAGTRAESGFLSFGTAVTTSTIAIKAAALAGFTFSGTLGRIALAIPQVRLALIVFGGVLAALGLGKFAKAGLALSASFEQTAVSLGILTGSAESAEKVLADVNKIVLATPFGLEQLAGVSRTLAVVFGENTEAISEFTRITADIAAISGRPVEQIGQQIQRAITSGLASAEVLRESGITPLLLEVSGAADSAALSGDKLLDAFRALTAEGGRGFGAAAAQAKTLEGALSNAQIAQEAFNRAFGDALAPSTISRAMTTQRSFVSLAEAIGDVTPLIEALNFVFALFVNFVRTSFTFAVRGITLAFTGLANGLAIVQVLIFSAAAVFDVLGKSIGEATRLIVAVVRGDFIGAFEELEAILDTIATSPVVAGLGTAFETLVEGSESVAKSFRGFLRVVPFVESLANAIGIQTEETEKNTKSTKDNTSEQEANAAALIARTKAQQEVAEELRKLQTQLTIEPGIRAEIEALDEEIRRVSQLDAALVDQVRQAEVLNELARQRARLTNELQVAQNRLPQILEDVNAQIQGLTKIDPRAARDFAEQLNSALEQADPTAQVQAAAEIGQAIRDRNEDAAIASAMRIARETKAIELQKEREVQNAKDQIAGITAQAEIDRLEGLTREIELVDRQIAQVRELGMLTEDRAKTEAAINLLQAQRLDLLEQQAEVERLAAQATANLPNTLLLINAQIRQLAELDPQAATRFALQLQEGLSKAGDDPAAAIKFAANLSQQIRDALGDIEPPETFGSKVATTLQEPLTNLLTGRSENFGQELGQAILDNVGPSLDEAFTDSVKLFGTKLQEAVLELDLFAEGGALGGLGEFLGSEVGKSALGILGAGLKSAFADEESTARAASNITSAVTSTQAVRGIVAGPTQIAIAQVDRAISDAFIETNRILARIEENTRSSASALDDTGTGSLPTGGMGPATQALANEGPSLV